VATWCATSHHYFTGDFLALKNTHFCEPGPAGIRSIPKELLEPRQRQCSVVRPILDIAMAEIGLDRPGVVGDFITAGMAQHVGMGFDDRIRSRNCPLVRPSR
jgi:hypothetical protein